MKKGYKFGQESMLEDMWKLKGRNRIDMNTFHCIHVGNFNNKENNKTYHLLLTHSILRLDLFA